METKSRKEIHWTCKAEHAYVDMDVCPVRLQSGDPCDRNSTELATLTPEIHILGARGDGSVFKVHCASMGTCV